MAAAKKAKKAPPKKPASRKASTAASRQAMIPETPTIAALTILMFILSLVFLGMACFRYYQTW